VQILLWGHMRAAFLGVVVCLAAQSRGTAQEAYFVIVFGSQRPVINRPAHTHSWATFVRVACDPVNPRTLTVEPHTVSWLPATLKIRPLAFVAEPGVNLDLHRTLAWALDDDQRVTMWGPYQIDRALFERALVKQSRLERGEVRYKADDTGYNSDQVSNCVHAVADISQGPRLRVGQPGWGASASYFVALTYRPFIINEQTTHDWLLDALTLRGYPIARRDLEDNPTRNVVLRAMQNVWQYRLR
jgi:hypothetical protein